MKKSLQFIVGLLLLCLFSCGNEASDPIVDPEEPNDGENIVTVEPLDELPQSRVNRLKKGLNLGHWFAQTEITTVGLKERFTEDDFIFIENSGFGYVRISVEEQVVYTEGDPKTIRTEYLSILDNAIQDFIDRDIAVLFDFHPTGGFKDKIHWDVNYSNSVKLFWGAMAKHLSKFDPEYLYLEVLNEPWATNASDWYPVQEAWVKMIRSEAPAHTIIVDGNLRYTENEWDDVKAVISMPILDDPNIVYNFHFYAPMQFTHQGATWGWSALVDIEGLKYPVDAANAYEIRDRVGNSNMETYWSMDNYVNDDWNKHALVSKLQAVGEWASTNNLTVICNEVGVYNYVTPTDSRIQYLQDVREALEEQNIGWAIWEYDQGFNIIDRESADVKFLDGIQNALGL
ncbi:glycoside hydrolase family 5 protein [Sediminitomix flava]|uniref:Endoglucanase n=1 Tax=Sediminitomix flava TaxID=379075 RepID=A0A315Z0I0_SEDFL|nr:cellulase family glycosylhydrolase [Sediminitomix flava]PWJ34971.1 endoglucanase [Sediminitomix flava]